MHNKKKRLRNFINTDSSFKKNSFHKLIKNNFKFTQGWNNVWTIDKKLLFGKEVIYDKKKQVKKTNLLSYLLLGWKLDQSRKYEEYNMEGFDCNISSNCIFQWLINWFKKFFRK